jgi:hypothetical protein
MVLSRSYEIGKNTFKYFSSKLLKGCTTRVVRDLKTWEISNSVDNE